MCCAKFLLLIDSYLLKLIKANYTTNMDSSVGIATGYGLDGPGIEFTGLCPGHGLRTPAETVKSGKKFKNRLVRALQLMADNDRNRPGMRNVSKYPDTQWSKVWQNVHHPALSDGVKATWYMVVHEIVPTNERLAAKRITNTDRCSRCARLDSLPHRITDCQEEGGVWNWTKAKIAQILRMDPKYISVDWALRPTLTLSVPN
jgi:hypothetical protein